MTKNNVSNEERQAGTIALRATKTSQQTVKTIAMVTTGLWSCSSLRTRFAKAPLRWDRSHSNLLRSQGTDRTNLFVSVEMESRNCNWANLRQPSHKKESE